MSWAEIKKAVNSDFSTPLNTLITNFLNNSTYGLNAIKTQVVKNQNWYAKYGTSTTLVSKTTETVGTSTNLSGNSKNITLFTADIPEDGVYQWSLNSLKTGASTSSGGTTSNYANDMMVNIEIESSAILSFVDRDNSGYKILESPSWKPNTNKNLSGYIYLCKGMRISLKVRYNEAMYGDYYQWVKVASAYLKYVKQTI